MLQVDISGSGGNAFALLGNVQQWGKDLGMSKEQVKKITEEMITGDYENLCRVIMDYFGDYVLLVDNDAR